MLKLFFILQQYCVAVYIWWDCRCCPLYYFYLSVRSVPLTGMAYYSQAKHIILFSCVSAVVLLARRTHTLTHSLHTNAFLFSSTYAIGSLCLDGEKCLCCCTATILFGKICSQLFSYPHISNALNVSVAQWFIVCPTLWPSFLSDDEHNNHLAIHFRCTITNRTCAYAYHLCTFSLSLSLARFPILCSASLYSKSPINS